MMISSTRSMLKTIGGCMLGRAARCVPQVVPKLLQAQRASTEDVSQPVSRVSCAKAWLVHPALKILIFKRETGATVSIWQG